MSYFRALAVDYDGTLTLGRRPEPQVLDALREARAAGLALVLVTGRILASLRNDFPEVGEHFDAIVAENGGVLSVGGAERALAPAVSTALARARAAWHRGRAGPRPARLERGARGGGRDRDPAPRLRVPPVPEPDGAHDPAATVSKGAGLCEALAELGISSHSALAAGDAENDHSLVDVCELASPSGTPSGRRRPPTRRGGGVAPRAPPGDRGTLPVTGDYAGAAVLASVRGRPG
jgi:hypothetical protein